jgi:hypothetical protein
MTPWSFVDRYTHFGQKYHRLVYVFFERSSLYNHVNKANLVHNLFLVYLSIPTCFGRLWARNQEKQLCLCDTW